MIPELIILKKCDVILTQIKSEELEFYLSIYSNPGLMKYVNFYNDSREIEKYFNQISDYSNIDKKIDFVYVINQDGLQKGVVGLYKIDEKEFEIGIILKKVYQGSGIATKVKKSVMYFVFDKLAADRIIARCDSRNLAANHINEKLGMILEDIVEEKKNNRFMNQWVIQSKRFQNKQSS